MCNKSYLAYKSWSDMKQRCNNPNNPRYSTYGKRGITYDIKWESFAGFLEDMGDRPTTNHTLDRVDVNGNYCKSNCQWLSKSENSSKDKVTHGKSKTKEYKDTINSKWYLENTEYKRMYNSEYRENNKDVINMRKRLARLLGISYKDTIPYVSSL